jgi:hypothetical protein
MVYSAAGAALFYDETRTGIKSNFNAFKVEREDGALMGPWSPWLHEPQIGNAWGLLDPYVFGRSQLTPISTR